MHANVSLASLSPIANKIEKSEIGFFFFFFSSLSSNMEMSSVPAICHGGASLLCLLNKAVLGLYCNIFHQ